MSSKLTYFFLFMMLFLIEVLIAMYAHDDFIRPYLGDFLVVIMMYCFVMAFMNYPAGRTALSVLVFAYLIEGLQYANFVSLIGLEDSKIANIIMGNYFSWVDILAYTLGILLVLIVEKLRGPDKNEAGYKSKDKAWLFL